MTSRRAIPTYGRGVQGYVEVPQQSNGLSRNSAACAWAERRKSECSPTAQARGLRATTLPCFLLQRPQRTRGSVKTGSRFPNAGRVRAVVHREPVGELKSITLSRTPTENTSRIVCSRTAEDARVPAQALVGVDVGLTHIAIESTGRKTYNRGCQLAQLD
jgi:hypothetical protein